MRIQNRTIVSRFWKEDPRETFGHGSRSNKCAEHRGRLTPFEGEIGYPGDNEQANGFCVPIDHLSAFTVRYSAGAMPACFLKKREK